MTDVLIFTILTEFSRHSSIPRRGHTGAHEYLEPFGHPFELHQPVILFITYIKAFFPQRSQGVDHAGFRFVDEAVKPGATPNLFLAKV
jgi:hypothetical protein